VKWFGRWVALSFRDPSPVWALVILGLVILSPVTTSPAAGTLRICADPDNLPFSSATASERGFYIDLAELVAARLGRTTEYVWWATYYGRRAVRNTLLAERCDAYVGLPSDSGYFPSSVVLTRPFLDVGYAIMAPATLPFRRLDDLRGRRIAVQFGSPPQLFLATHEGFSVTTFKLAEEALDALARAEVDAAFVWGPVAGYYNQRKLGGAYHVVTVSGRGMNWQASIGVKKDHEDLRQALDAALSQLQPEIRGLAAKYGFPDGAPMDLDAQTTSPDNRVPKGRSVFNQHCAHCHAPNAQSAEPSRDLRRLKRRYGEAMSEVFYKTVTDGRPDKGMPPWKGVLAIEDLRSVGAFLESIQAEP
jgi:ABC-type amino acid transport substrate-binding protein